MVQDQFKSSTLVSRSGSKLTMLCHSSKLKEAITHKYLNSCIKESLIWGYHYVRTIYRDNFRSISVYRLWKDKMLVIGHIKIPVSVVNGSQLLLLWKSDVMKTMEYIEGKMPLSKRREISSEPREVIIQAVKFRSVFTRSWRRSLRRSGTESNNAENRATPAPV